MNIEHKLQDTKCVIRNKGITILGLGLLIQTMKLWQAKDEKGNPITRTEFEMRVMDRQGEMEKGRKGNYGNDKRFCDHQER